MAKDSVNNGGRVIAPGHARNVPARKGEPLCEVILKSHQS